MNGNINEKDATYKLEHKSVTIFETIKSQIKSTKSVSSYEHQQNGVTKTYHTSTNIFTDIGNGTTLPELYVEQKVVGIIPRIVMTVFAGAIKNTIKNCLTILSFLPKNNK